MILVLDTSKEDIFIGTWDKKKGSWGKKEVFPGGRELNALIIDKLDILNGVKLSGIIVAAGPGSFTGLRIGMSVANTVAYIKDIPIVAPIETNDVEDLLQRGLSMLESAGSQFDGAVTPHYGSEPHITKPKH